MPGGRRGGGWGETSVRGPGRCMGGTRNWGMGRERNEGKGCEEGRWEVRGGDCGNEQPTTRNTVI